jgi:hypothetical protein
MRGALLSLALSSSLVGLFIACGSETPATPGGVNDGGSGEGSPDGDQGPRDAGYDGPVTPDGCRLKTTDYRAGAKAQNLARPEAPGAVAWQNPENAISEDGKFATVTLNDGQESAELRISEFGINLPTTVDTYGIEVELKRQAPEGGVEDAQITLAIDGHTAGEIDFKFVKGGWPTKIMGTHHYGQALDTWKLDLYPADVNKQTFAARLWVKKQDDAGPGPVTAIVEAMKVAVWYCPK